MQARQPIYKHTKYPGNPCKHDYPYINIQNTQRSEEHTSELQSLTNLVCRLLLEKKNITQKISFQDNPHLSSITTIAARRNIVTTYQQTNHLRHIKTP